MYVHDEPTVEFLPKAQNLVQYIRTYSRSTPTFGAFIFGFGQTPNQLSVWRDVDDVPMIDNYPIAYSKPIGGASPTTYPTLTPEPKPYPPSEGVQQSVWKLLLSVNGQSYHLADNAGRAPDRFSRAGLGRADDGEVADVRGGPDMAWQAIFGGANALMFWSAGIRGEVYIRACRTTAAMRSHARRSTRPH